MNCIHPFMTKKNYCMHCGAKDSLRYIDLQNESHKQLLFATSKVKCEKCGTEFFFHWINENGEMCGYFSDKDIVDKFSTEIIDYAKFHRRKLL